MRAQAAKPEAEVALQVGVIRKVVGKNEWIANRRHECSMLVIVGYAEEAGARTEQSEEAEFEAIQSNGLSVMLLLLLRLQSW